LILLGTLLKSSAGSGKQREGIVRVLCRQVVILVAVIAAIPATASADATPIAQWHIQSSQAVSAGGEALSTPGFADGEWLPVSSRSTVMA
jgi:hypothetical protein